jgi:hypothetical protein
MKQSNLQKECYEFAEISLTYWAMHPGTGFGILNQLYLTERTGTSILA